MELKGKVVKILPLVSGNGQRGEWKMQSVIVEYGDTNYKNLLELTNMNEADKFGALTIGYEYIFYFDVKSREYQGKYFTTCNCYRWTLSESQAINNASQQPTPQPQYYVQNPSVQPTSTPQPQYISQQPYQQPQNQLYQQHEVPLNVPYAQPGNDLPF